MTEMTAETTTEIDDDITLADGKRTLTNSQLLILGFIASYGVAGCSESKRDIAEALQVSLKTVDRAILRLGACELLHRKNLPAPVVISEAIRLAERFSSADSPRFVNGVLAGIAKTARPS